MIYKEYGKTGKKISAISFGGMRFHKEDYLHSLENAVKVVHRASELGINYFDTAPGYCEDYSEKIFGEAFKSMPNPFYVSTKLWRCDAPDARKVLENSLKTLQVEKINFYHMWCINSLETYQVFMKKGGGYEMALKAKDEGLIDHIVFSTHASGEEIETIIKDGFFEGVTLGYNAANFAFRQQGIKAAHAHGLGVMTMNPLGGGIIPKHPDVFNFLIRDQGDTLPQAALKFLVSHPEITAALPGMGTIAEVEENVKTVENFTPYSAQTLTDMAQNINKTLNTLCTGCQYCEGCPVGIDIPKYMEAYNHKIIEKTDKSVVDTIKWHWSISKEPVATCIACGKCETLCTQKLPIIERLKAISEMAD
ncbi:MAG: aldo/keto reductase [Hyphomonadaceae bacterium]|nr:aldo/keto reductase [Clostridia bacterium]